MKHGYPLAVRNITISSYLAARRTLLGGLVSRAILASRGIIAGCATATSDLRMLLVNIVNAHTSKM